VVICRWVEHLLRLTHMLGDESILIWKWKRGLKRLIEEEEEEEVEDEDNVILEIADGGGRLFWYKVA